MFKRFAALGMLLLFAFGVLALPAFAREPVAGRAGRAELRFLEGMIDHHQMALDMSNDCLKKASAAEVKTLCQDIIKAQTAEITTMQVWIKDWHKVDYKPMSMIDVMKNMGGMDHSNMPGMMATDPAMMMGMMAGLNRLQGKDYDVAWLEAMIDHHDDAIHMSNRILKNTGIHDEVKTLATTIIKDQTAEIQKMEDMIKAMGQ
jgi:uncharacterized protein (DUF305 family)